MNKLMTVALYVVLSAGGGPAAQAQVASNFAKAAPMQRQIEPVIHCTSNNSGVGATQPRESGAGESDRLAADSTRQEFECVMSGVCGVTDRGRMAS